MKLKHYLIPSEQNDYKPWVLSTTALGVFCLCIWSLRILIPASITLAAETIDATDLMNKINLERTQRFIPAVATNSKLTQAANGKASDMIERSYFSHIDPNGNYVWERIESAGYAPYLTLGENLAMDFSSASGVVSGWMNSPTHRENIVNAKFEDQGLAAIAGNFEPNHDTIMVVSLLGTLYKTKSITNKPTPPPPPASKPVAVIPKPKPTVLPSTNNNTKVNISSDIKVTQTSLSGKTLVNINVIIAGSPALVTANLKTQVITLLRGQILGEYVGSFTFDATEDLTEEILIVSAQDKSGAKVSLDHPINIQSGFSQNAEPVGIPVSSEAQIIKILRIIFGVFAAIYMAFLAIDAVIIHRAKIKREGPHSNPHILLLLLIATVNLFANWF